ncbi:MAG: GTPase ObgE [Clostridia bacterium]|nr:GTPase ObgE [Clostridia bacterium]
MFVDKEHIIVKAGNGGDGATSFIHYKGVTNGGPDGGDGGDGGSIYFIGDKRKSSLIDFYYKRKYFAENGTKGGPKKCYGKSGEDLVIPVPLGTVIRDKQTGNIVCDIFYDGEKKLVLQGGAGGKGNVKFCTPTRHAPHFAQKGVQTEPVRLVLELKTIADVGLLGFPSVGKSTLLSKISGAKPKIAAYHFTTLSPNLGVVRHYDDSFVVADIPGLIEGAAQGAGLGHEFLRHIERTRMLIHIVDISGVEGRDPIDDFIKLNKELEEYDINVANLKQIVVANKMDIDGAEENLKAFKKKFGKKYKIFPITALNSQGIEEMFDEVYETLKTLPPVQPIEYEEFKYERKDESQFDIVRDDDGAYVVVGPLVDLLCRNVVLDDVDSLAYMQKTLRNRGVFKALKKLGIKDGDTVVIGEVEFDYLD